MISADVADRFPSFLSFSSPSSPSSSVHFLFSSTSSRSTRFLSYRKERSSLIGEANLISSNARGAEASKPEFRLKVSRLPVALFLGEQETLTEADTANAVVVLVAGSGGDGEGDDVYDHLTFTLNPQILGKEPSGLRPAPAPREHHRQAVTVDDLQEEGGERVHPHSSLSD
ncbi:hypothetical protein TYRP_015940 [Tyrophagus putrescentiae]|nr:hypothetical protein TYRP_015940 [Tyrophagus putrescentiae]